MTVIERLATIPPADNLRFAGARRVCVDGHDWAVGCDGHVCVAIRCSFDIGALPVGEQPDAQTLASWMARRPAGRISTNVAAIRAWAAKAVPEFVECPACNGDPTSVQEECEMCDGTGEHECSCGDLHDCVECKGAGTSDGCQACDEGKIRSMLVVGRVAGWTGFISHVNLNVVAKGLAGLADVDDAAAVDVDWGRESGEMIHLVPADGAWFMVVAPMCGRFEEVKTAVLG